MQLSTRSGLGARIHAVDSALVYTQRTRCLFTSSRLHAVVKAVYTQSLRQSSGADIVHPRLVVLLYDNLVVHPYAELVYAHTDAVVLSHADIVVLLHAWLVVSHATLVVHTRT